MAVSLKMSCGCKDFSSLAFRGRENFEMEMFVEGSDLKSYWWWFERKTSIINI